MRSELDADAIGATHYSSSPGRRAGFGPCHGEVEEVYLVYSGSGRFKLDDAIVTVGPGDAIYCPSAAVRVGGLF